METFSVSLALCVGNSPVNLPYKGQWRGGLVFSLICAWTNGSSRSTNNRDTSDLRRYRIHSDITVVFLRKWPKTGILTYFGAQSGLKIGLLKPTFSSPLKVLRMSMWSNNDVKPVKIFEKMTWDQNFHLFWDPKWSQNWASEAQIQHTSKSSKWNNTGGTFLRKWPQTEILNLFWDPKIGKNRILRLS